MKKLLLILSLLSAAGSAHALESVYGDLFNYENKASSFTVDVDASKLDRFSIQLIFSTENILDLPITGASISTLTDAITISTSNIATGQRVLLATATTPAPQPLATGTTYFVVKVSDSLLKLATTYAQAATRDTIDILGPVVSSNTFTLRVFPLSLGAAGVTWTASNDGTNYVAVASVGAASVNASTQSLTGATSTIATRFVDWGEFSYRFLRLVFAGPADGAVKLRAYLSGKLRE